MLIDTPENPASGLPSGDHQFWSWEITRRPEADIFLRVVNDCGTHWTVWNVMQAAVDFLPSSMPMGTWGWFQTRDGRWWSARVTYHNTRAEVIRHLRAASDDGTERFYAIAVVGLPASDEPEPECYEQDLRQPDEPEVCGATFVTAGVDPYGTSCDLPPRHPGIDHEGMHPMGGDERMSWQGGGSAGGDPLPYRNVQGL